MLESLIHYYFSLICKIMVLYYKLSSVVVISGIPLIHKICIACMVMALFTGISCTWTIFNIIDFSLKVLHLIIDCIIDIGYRIL